MGVYKRRHNAASQELLCYEPLSVNPSARLMHSKAAREGSDTSPIQEGLVLYGRSVTPARFPSWFLPPQEWPGGE